MRGSGPPVTALLSCCSPLPPLRIRAMHSTRHSLKQRPPPPAPHDQASNGAARYLLQQELLSLSSPPLLVAPDLHAAHLEVFKESLHLREGGEELKPQHAASLPFPGANDS